MQNTSRLLSAVDFADRLHTTPGAIYTARHRGDLPPAIKVGKRVLWRESDVERWLDERREVLETR
jgi:predicted DNA-binding transcriptional regulator AlpA